jgi:hypothetical protein
MISSSSYAISCLFNLSSFYFTKLLKAVYASIALSSSVCSGFKIEKYETYFESCKSMFGFGRKSNNFI